MASIEVLSGPERRRRWSDDQKRAVVEAAFLPGAAVREVARKADVTPSLIYRWRRQLRAGTQRFAPVIVAYGEPDVAQTAVPVVEIDLCGGTRIRIGPSAPPALAAAIVEVLSRR